MNPIAETDLGHFVKHIVMALEPLALEDGIYLNFLEREKTLALFQPSGLACDLSGLLTRLISYTPSEDSIIVSIVDAENQICKIVIHVTGINLSRVNEITKSCKLPFKITRTDNLSTCYELKIELVEIENPVAANELELDQNVMPGFFGEIRKRLQSHFTKADNLVAVLSHKMPHDATFLAKVNSLILNNMENNQFDTNHLSEAMHMSRTQLFRRLKPIIRQSPGSYIRNLKLQRAKELLETTDMRIGEIANKSGFETASHFTRTFTKKYGVNPSLFSRNRSNSASMQQMDYETQHLIYSQ